MGFLLGVSRVVAEAHYPGELLAGAAVGMPSAGDDLVAGSHTHQQGDRLVERPYLLIVSRLKGLKGQQGADHTRDSAVSVRTATSESSSSVMTN